MSSTDLTLRDLYGDDVLKGRGRRLVRRRLIERPFRRELLRDGKGPKGRGEDSLKDRHILRLTGMIRAYEEGNGINRVRKMMKGVGGEKPSPHSGLCPKAGKTGKL